MSRQNDSMEPFDDHRASELQILEIERQAREIASEHNFDRDIDHSQPHDPTDMEREFERIQNNEGYRSCRCEDYPCCGH